MQVGIAQAVDLTHQVEQRGTGFGRAKVVVHRLGETLDVLFATRGLDTRQATQGMVEALQGAL
ncbi:hypothetical protein D3C86_1812990 [compost metagenome]